jgi:hypothetical protein
MLWEHSEEKNMTARSWKLRVASVSVPEVEAWLRAETNDSYIVATTDKGVVVDFLSIDDAFRCRLHFDDVLLT